MGQPEGSLGGGALLPALAQPEFVDRDSDGLGDLHQGLDGEVLATVLDALVVAGLHPGPLGDLLLGEPRLFAQLCDALRDSGLDLLDGLHDR